MSKKGLPPESSNAPIKNFSIKFPRVGNERSIKSVKKAPTPGEKF